MQRSQHLPRWWRNSTPTPARSCAHLHCSTGLSESRRWTCRLFTACTTLVASSRTRELGNRVSRRHRECVVGQFKNSPGAGHGSRHVTARLPWPTGLTRAAMCRNIKTLFNFEPPATEAEIRDASLQFVRKICGFTSPSKANELAFERAVEEVTASARALIRSLVTTAEPRNREVESEKLRARSAVRFGPKQ
jgi:hypothetical protein